MGFTRRNRVRESTGERQIADGLERTEGDDTYKSSTEEYDLESMIEMLDSILEPQPELS